MTHGQFDQFADVIFSQNGIFAGTEAGLEPGLAKHDTVQTTAAPDGVHNAMDCRGCGRPVDVVISYPEMVALKYRVPPQAAFAGTAAQVNTEYRWSAPHGAFYPMLTCSSCHMPCAPLVTPEEAEQHLAQARANGWIAAKNEAQLAQVAHARSEQWRSAIVRTPNPGFR